MKVRYDKEVDAAYIQLSRKRPQGAVEIQEGVILHLTEKDELVSIEILNASKRFPIRSLFTFQVDR
jgi:uncharacterized protein YuzE